MRVWPPLYLSFLCRCVIDHVGAISHGKSRSRCVMGVISRTSLCGLCACVLIYTPHCRILTRERARSQHALHATVVRGFDSVPLWPWPRAHGATNELLTLDERSKRGREAGEHSRKSQSQRHSSCTVTASHDSRAAPTNASARRTRARADVLSPCACHAARHARTTQEMLSTCWRS